MIFGGFRPVDICGRCGKKVNCECTLTQPSENLKTYNRLAQSIKTAATPSQYNITPHVHASNLTNGPTQIYCGSGPLNSYTLPSFR